MTIKMQDKINRLMRNEQVQTLLEAFGAEAELHLVGGAVRDLALDKEAKDLDFATKLTPSEMIEKLNAAGIRFVETGIRRGTITAILGSEPLEVTTFRNPSLESEFTETIEEDLPARDFTINAIAIDLNAGKLVDPFGGLEDLEHGIISCVREPGLRFTEDPHRILRMVRFGPGQGREVSPETLKAAKEHKEKLKDVSIERISDELAKIICLPGAKAAFIFMEQTGILDLIIPELREAVGFAQNKFHVKDVFGHILDVLEAVPATAELRFAALFHDIGKPRSLIITDKGRQFIGHENVSAEMAEEIMTRLKRPKLEKRNVVTLVKHHMRHVNVGPKSVRKTMFILEDLFESWLALKKADLFAPRASSLTWDIKGEWESFLQAVETEKKRPKSNPKRDLAVTGKDLIEIGFEQGPELGKVLQSLQELVLEAPSANVREVLLSCAKTQLGEK